MANDDMGDLKASVEAFKQMEEIRKSSVTRNLSFGGDIEEKPDMHFEAGLRYKFNTMRDLIESDAWQLVLEVMDEIVEAHKTTMPGTVDGQIAYMTYSIARDTKNQIINSIQQRAALGSKPQTELLHEEITV